MSSNSSSSIISSSTVSQSSNSTKSFQEEQLDKLKEVLQEFPLPLCVECCQPDNLINSVIGYVQPDFSVVAYLYTDGITHREVYPNCMAFVTACYLLWEQDPEYFHMTTAQDILRSLSVGSGSWADTSLWYMYQRFPGNMEDAGYREDQMTCRRRLGNLIPKAQFLIRGRRVRLESNHLFSYGEKRRLTCAMAVKETTGRDVSEDEALTMMFLLDGKEEEEPDETIIGYGLSLDEILKTFSLFKLRYLGHDMKEYDYGITMEVQQYLALIKHQPSKEDRIPFVVRLMDFLYEDGIDFVKKHPVFYTAVVSKCQEFIQVCANENPECSSSCQQLLDKLLPGSSN